MSVKNSSLKYDTAHVTKKFRYLVFSTAKYVPDRINYHFELFLIGVVDLVW